MKYIQLSPDADIDMLGFIPDFISEHNPDDAKTQFDKNYQHGGGWRDFKGFSWDPVTKKLQYPGDPPMKPLFRTLLRNEHIFFYPHAWVLILHPDGTHSISRMD